MKPWKIVFLAVWLGTGCGAPKPVSVDPAPFMALGRVFMQTLMRGQFAQAYDQYISPGAKYTPRFSKDQFIADWQAIVEKYGAITRARLTHLQLVPGKKVVQLYYQVAQGKAESLEYHLVGEMDPKGRCTIFLIDIGNVEKYPRQGDGGEKQTAPAAAEIMP